MTLTDKIAAAALSMVGTPFKHQGRVPGVGLDCFGLIVAAGRSAGIDVADEPYYDRTPAPGLVQATLARTLARYHGAPGISHVPVFWIRQDLGGQHCGIIVGGDRIVHAVAAPGIDRVVVHRLYSMRHQILEYYAWPQ